MADRSSNGDVERKYWHIIKYYLTPSLVGISSPYWPTLYTWQVLVPLAAAPVLEGACGKKVLAYNKILLDTITVMASVVPTGPQSIPGRSWYPSL